MGKSLLHLEAQACRRVANRVAKRVAKRVASTAAWLEESLLALLLAGMTGVAFANVIARRVFASSFPWALELTLNLFLYLVLLGMAYALRRGLHASVDALVVRLAPRAERVCHLLASLCVVVYAVVLSATGFQIARLFWTNAALRSIGSEEIGIPHWLTYGVLCFSFGYLAITAAASMVAVLLGKTIRCKPSL